MLLFTQGNVETREAVDLKLILRQIFARKVMPGRNSMCIGNQKGVSRLGPLVVSFFSLVINEEMHINFRFLIFFLYSSYVLSKSFSIFENSSEKIGFLGLIYFNFLFFLFAITGLLEGIMIIIIHQNVHEDMSNNIFL